MREPTFFTLAALLDGPLHGYGIVQRASELTAGRLRLTAGTLYGALDRLREEGLITETGQEIVDGRARRYYSLTDDGRSALETEAERMEQAAAIVRPRPTAIRTKTRPA